MTLSAVISLFALCFAHGEAGPAADARVVLYPAPGDEPASADYQVWVNNEPVHCYTSYRFDVGSSVTIAGRPVSPVSFAYFDFEGTVEIRVRLLPGLAEAGLDTSTVVIRPLAHGITPEVAGGEFQFRLTKRNLPPFCQTAATKWNARRAHLVVRAEDWRWSRLWRRLHGRDSQLLSDGPVLRPDDWLQRVNQP